MTANHITELLRKRHKEDVFVSQCKNGASGRACGGLKILDAWVMKKQWLRPLVIGYEIKISRSDFLQDKKWRDYLPYCNKFYFVCSFGLIHEKEIPDGIGLLWTTKNGKQLRYRKPAKNRDVDIPQDIFRYILMNRVQIIEEKS